LISREQADAISDQLLGIEKNTGTLKIDIPKSGKTVLLPVLLTPFFLGSLWHDAEVIVAWVPVRISSAIRSTSAFAVFHSASAPVAVNMSVNQVLR
jgi:hypothetical protein